MEVVYLIVGPTLTSCAGTFLNLFPPTPSFISENISLDYDIK